MIVIVIIGILAALVIVAYKGIQERAKTAKAITDLKAITKVLNVYYIDNNAYPPEDGTWNDTAEKAWSKPYGLNWPKNPWGYEYHLESPSRMQGFPTSISILYPGQAGAQNIDNAADDGNLSTGLVRGNGSRLEYAKDLP